MNTEESLQELDYPELVNLMRSLLDIHNFIGEQIKEAGLSDCDAAGFGLSVLISEQEHVMTTMDKVYAERQHRKEKCRTMLESAGL